MTLPVERHNSAPVRICRYPRAARIVFGTLGTAAFAAVTFVAVSTQVKEGYEPVFALLWTVTLVLMGICIWPCFRMVLGLDEVMITRGQITFRRGKRQTTIAVSSIQDVEFLRLRHPFVTYRDYVFRITTTSGIRVNLPVGLTDAEHNETLTDILIRILPHVHSSEVKRAIEVERPSRQ